MRETKTVAIWGWEQKIENERTWSKARFSCMSITTCLISLREPASTPRAAAEMVPRKISRDLIVAESGKIPGGSRLVTRFDQKCRYDSLYTSEVGNTRLQRAGRYLGGLYKKGLQTMIYNDCRVFRTMILALLIV
jgi:hypothetical protein